MTPEQSQQIQHIEAKLDEVLTILKGDGLGNAGVVAGLAKAHDRIDAALVRIGVHDALEERRAADRRGLMNTVIGGVLLAAALAVGGVVMAGLGWARHIGGVP